jgi:hypothetical protein
MRKTLRLLLPAAVILALAAPGCYTVVMHPSDDDGYRASQTSDCVRCHSDYHQYPYGYYYSPYPSWWWTYPSYSSYYAYPWWWQYYDYPYLDGNGYDYSSSGLSTHEGTKFDRHETRPGPVPPPHSLTGSGNDQWIYPGLPDVSGDFQPGTGSSGTQTRPGQTGDTGPRTKDEGQGSTDSKDTRDAAGRPIPKSDPTVQPDNTRQDNPPADSTDKDKGKKKSRREGDGR